MPGRGRTPKKFTYWSHLGAMLFSQGSARKSLGALVSSLNRQRKEAREAVRGFVDTYNRE